MLKLRLDTNTLTVLKGQGRNKYNVDTSEYGKLKRTVDGILFASQDEATRYVILRGRQERGGIKNLTLQPRFVIIPAFTDSSGKRHRATHYTADFQYEELGETIIEEVKGKASRDFPLRMKLFLKHYPQYRYRLVKSEEILIA